MTLATGPGEAYQPYSPGPALQRLVPTAEIGFTGTTIAASGSLVSNVIQTDGMRSLALGLTSSQAGVVSVQRWIDQNGSIAQGVSLFGTLVAATATVLNSTDDNPYQALTLTITNTGSVTATVSRLGLLLQAT